MSPSVSTSGDQRLLATGADMGHLQPLLCLLSALAAASNQFASRTEVSVYDLGGNSSASILATPARRQLLLAGDAEERRLRALDQVRAPACMSWHSHTLMWQSACTCVSAVECTGTRWRRSSVRQHTHM